MAATGEYSEEIINFPVPKRYLGVVVQALASAMEQDRMTAGVSSVDSSVIEHTTVGGIDWTNLDNCKRLRQELRAPAALVMLDLTAARPNEFVSFEEVVRESGHAEKQARADLGVLTKVIRRVFGVAYDSAIWPVEIRWGASDDPQAHYRMKPEVANAWGNAA